MHTFKAEVIANYFGSTPDTMLRHHATSYRGLFIIDAKHYTCCAKGYPVPNSFVYVSELFYDGSMFVIYRVTPKAYTRLA